MLHICTVCGLPVDRTMDHVAITRSIEFHETISCSGLAHIIPQDVIELAVFHTRCCPSAAFLTKALTPTKVAGLRRN